MNIRRFTLYASWVLTVLTAIVVTKVCMGRILALENVEKSQSWYPGYSVTILKQGAITVASEMSDEDSETVLINARRALKRAPLSDEALIQLGAAQSAKDKSRFDERYLVKALSRNNRNRMALRLMLTTDIIRQDFDKAVEKLDVLMRLSGGNEDDFRDAIRGLSAVPEGRNRINTFLAERVSWGRYFVLNQINSMNSETYQGVARSLEQYSFGEYVMAEDKLLHENFMRRLIGLGKYEAAYAHWLAISTALTKSYDIKASNVYNETFKNLESLPPFNWNERQQEKYYSEFSQSEGLVAVFNDDATRALTTQILNLEAGKRYSLKVEAEWSYRDFQGQFFWAISCLETGERISQISLNELQRPKSGGENSFQVAPENCDWQRISLFAQPGSVSGHIRSQTRSVKIFAETDE